MFENKITITAPFWRQYLNLVQSEMLPFQWDVLNDAVDIKIEKERDADHIPAEKSHAIENFKIAAGLTEGSHYGMVFQDSDVYKWLEAAAYALHQQPDDDLQQIADGVIELLAKAQEDDGYLNTYFSIEEPERRYKRLYQSHELYCSGHFIEAAVGYYTVTGNKKVLEIACLLADNIYQHFGADDDKISGYDGHEEIELALLRLYEITKEEKYRDLARFFLYERGKNPDFFRQQQADDPSNQVMIEGMEGFKPSYYQNHKPLLEQETAEGHAVRVMYMCTGMAMLARLDNDEKMLEACRRLWKNIVTRRMYITGGIGSTVIGEAFTADYDLPNDTMYCETCASVGLIFFAHNMLKIESDSQYADVLERALYNTVINGMALDGKHFFYVNPLELVPELSRCDPGKSHVKTVRPAWFGCACCPPNLARLLCSLDEYAYRCQNDTIYADLYLGSTAVFDIAGQEIRLTQETSYPWQGRIDFTIQTAGVFKLALRLPGWAESYNVQLNGVTVRPAVQRGYIIIERAWKSGDTVVLDIPLTIKLVRANPLVREDYRKVAVQRGPVVYCVEGIDNGDNLHWLHIGAADASSAVLNPDFINGLPAICMPGKRLKPAASWSDVLYSDDDDGILEDCEITFIPYFCSLNRGENEMRIWLQQF